MYLRFGDYIHPENEVMLTYLSLQRMFSPRNQMAFMRKTLTIQGHLCLSGATAITAAIRKLEGGYLLEWSTVGLYESDGTATAHVLRSDYSVNGVRLLTLDYPTEDGGEYATGRTFRAVFQADYVKERDSRGKIIPIWESQIYAWEETVTAVGDGGPDWEFIPQYDGPPVFQMNCRYTPIHVVQSGEAIGLLDAIAAPLPYWPQYLHRNRTVIQRGTCQKKGRGDGVTAVDMLFPLKWTYYFSLLPDPALFGASGILKGGFNFSSPTEK